MQEIKIIQQKEYPLLLQQLKQLPEQLHIQGDISPLFDTTYKILCVVGTRRYTHYGKEVAQKLIAGLRGYNICIVSGLALGIDSIAHQAALDAGLPTIAFPGSGLDPSVLYPRAHTQLAREIVKRGGALVSGFDLTQRSTIWTFPARNALMAGVSHKTLIIECNLKSGSLITARDATGFGREVGAVPGSIFSERSEGVHDLIRDGATPITSTDDLLEFLGFARRNGQTKLSLGDNPRFKELGEVEQKILRFVQRGPFPRDVITHALEIHPQQLNRILTMLELEGFIKEESGVIRLM